MTTLKLTDDNDIQAVSNVLRFTADDSEYIVQKIKNRLLMFKGNWYLNTELGLPYFESMLDKRPNFRFIIALFSNALLEIEGITEVVSLEIADYNGANREISIQFKCVYNAIEIESEVVV